MRAITVARVGYAAAVLAGEVENNVQDDTVKQELEKIKAAGNTAIEAAATGDVNKALQVSETIKNLDVNKVASVSPEAAFLALALHGAINAYAHTAAVSLEELEELKQILPDVADKVGAEIKLDKVTSDELLQMATEAAVKGLVGEAKVLASVKSIVDQITGGTTEGATGTGSESTTGETGTTGEGTTGTEGTGTVG